MKIIRLIAKIPKAILVFSALALFVFNGILLGLSDLLGDIEVANISSIRNTMINLVPQLATLSTKWLILSIPLFLFICFMLIYKPVLPVIQHLSMDRSIASIDPEIKKNYWLRIKKLDQCGNLKNGIPTTKVICVLDEFVAMIKEKYTDKSIGFYGIAHTPLIFRLGYLVGDQQNIHLFHKARHNSSFFSEWSSVTNRLTLNTSEENQGINSNKLLVSIATSLPILDEHLSSLGMDDKHVLKFTASHLDFDSITSYNDAEHLRNQIMKTIRDTVVKYNISQIHMVLSTSSAFTFFLATAYSKQHDCPIIVYHYKDGQYPWGIRIKSPANKALYIKSKQT